MRLIYRLLIAGPLALVFLAAIGYVYAFGYFMGGMMTDSCSGSPGQVEGWLTMVWPNVLITSALMPPLLVVVKARWYWILLSLALGLAVSAACYFMWFPLLMLVC